MSLQKITVVVHSDGPRTALKRDVERRRRTINIIKQTEESEFDRSFSDIGNDNHRYCGHCYNDDSHDGDDYETENDSDFWRRATTQNLLIRVKPKSIDTSVFTSVAEACKCLVSQSARNKSCGLCLIQLMQELPKELDQILSDKNSHPITCNHYFSIECWNGVCVCRKFMGR